jgi:hypothetical protein
MKTYRNQIIEVVNKLIDAREIIFNQIVNLAMSNEFGHLHDTFDENDVYTFSLKHFEDIKDVNVQHLVKLCKKTEETIFALMNLNGIKNEEVNLDEDK